jgi:hypothetical protein
MSQLTLKVAGFRIKVNQTFLNLNDEDKAINIYNRATLELRYFFTLSTLNFIY